MGQELAGEQTKEAGEEMKEEAVAAFLNHPSHDAVTSRLANVLADGEWHFKADLSVLATANYQCSEMDCYDALKRYMPRLRQYAKRNGLRIESRTLRGNVEGPWMHRLAEG